ncbi:MAG: hypothetical protein MZU97_12055 [Bacillus subtilis]|nr:hypothetical protein [Bacillus subtilis]
MESFTLAGPRGAGRDPRKRPDLRRRDSATRPGREPSTRRSPSSKITRHPRRRPAATGYRLAKFYFMIGLPLPEVAGIAETESPWSTSFDDSWRDAGSSSTSTSEPSYRSPIRRSSGALRSARMRPWPDPLDPRGFPAPSGSMKIILPHALRLPARGHPEPG